MTADQLRKSILQQAIQGKLVPQDPNDEPASVLLERIREEKARLIKEKKAKREKTPSIIYRGEDNSHYEEFTATGEVRCIDDEVPFDLPDGWAWARLGLLVDFSSNQSVKSGQISSNSWLLDLEDIEKETGRVLRKKRFYEVLSKSDKHRFYSGNILYSKLRPYLNKVVLADEDGVCTSEILAFDFGEIYNRYALFFLRSPYFVEYAMKEAYGVKMPRLGSTHGNLALFPLPPLAEQERIVAKIEELMPWVEQYGKAQSELDQLNNSIQGRLRKSVLQYAIEGKLVPQQAEDGSAEELLAEIQAEKQRLYAAGKLKKKDLAHSTIFRAEDGMYYEQGGKTITCIDEEIPFAIPKSWCWVTIGNLFQHNNGKQLNKENSLGTLMSYITTSNLYWDGFKLDKLKKMPFTEQEIERCQAIKGDLLVCEGGDIGRARIWTYDYPIMLQNHIHKLRAYLPVCTKYFYYIFYLYNLTGAIRGKGIGIKGFSSRALHATRLPLPPLAEQERIAKKLDEIMPLIKRYAKVFG